MPDPTEPSQPRYWFPAKTYGLGGIPSTWEGWLVLLAYLILLPLAVAVFPPDRNMPGFIASVFWSLGRAHRDLLMEGRAPEAEIGRELTSKRAFRAAALRALCLPAIVRLLILGGSACRMAFASKAIAGNST
jgi:hypothetical protein